VLQLKVGRKLALGHCGQATLLSGEARSYEAITCDSKSARAQICSMYALKHCQKVDVQYAVEKTHEKVAQTRQERPT